MLYAFVSTGELSRMYTLRVASLVNTFEGTILVNTYYGNLSTDSNKANAKALEFCNENGIELRSGASFSLDEIRYNKDLESKLSREAFEAKKKAAEAEALKNLTEEYAELLSQGVILLPKFLGKTPAEVWEIAPDYIIWLKGVDHGTPNGKMAVSCELAKRWFNENFGESGHVGVEGEEFEITATVVKRIVTDSPFAYNANMYITTFIDGSGNMMKTFSSAAKILELDNGDKVNFIATIKKHELPTVYDNANTTLLVKPKKIKVL